jgi:hypothetical protein
MSRTCSLIAGSVLQGSYLLLPDWKPLELTQWKDREGSVHPISVQNYPRETPLDLVLVFLDICFYIDLH